MSIDNFSNTALSKKYQVPLNYGFGLSEEYLLNFKLD